MTVHSHGRNGTETVLCDVTVVLNIAPFMRKRVVFGEVCGSKCKPYFTWEMTEEFSRCSAWIIHLFFVVFCPIAGLQLSIWTLKVDKAWKRVPTKILTAIFCSKLSPVKGCAQTCACCESVKQSFFNFLQAILF